jgi:hypothetical protein
MREYALAAPIVPITLVFRRETQISGSQAGDAMIANVSFTRQTIIHQPFRIRHEISATQLADC